VRASRGAFAVCFEFGSGGGVCLGEDFYWVQDGAVTYVLDLHFAGAALGEDIGACG
jgi:hypothetical protein